MCRDHHHKAGDVAAEIRRRATLSDNCRVQPLSHVLRSTISVTTTIIFIFPFKPIHSIYLVSFWRISFGTSQCLQNSSLVYSYAHPNQSLLAELVPCGAPHGADIIQRSIQRALSRRQMMIWCSCGRVYKILRVSIATFTISYRTDLVTGREIPEEVAARTDQQNEFPAEMWKKLGEAG